MTNTLCLPFQLKNYMRAVVMFPHYASRYKLIINMKSEILIKDHDLESPSHTAWLLCGLLLPCLPRTITIVVTDQCIAAYLQQTVPSDYRYQDDGRMSSALLAQLCKMVVVISPRSILSNDYHCCWWWCEESQKDENCSL